MRCKKHITDLSSAVGVCASCLRDRLFVIIAAQVQEDRRNNTPPLMFPRSVSPYISRRKSDNFTDDTFSHHHHHQRELQFQRFFSTPHIGPSGKIDAGVCEKKKSKLRFSFFGNLFSFKYSDFPRSDSNMSWFKGWRRTKTEKMSMYNPTFIGQRSICRKAEKGMSPAKQADQKEDHRNNELSGETLSECTKQWKETPKRTAGCIPPGKRFQTRNASGFAFCFSPLIRASPSRNWNQKGIPTE